ncbi:MAG: nitroreductase family protein [Pseudomonadales bacterium]
MSNRPDFSARQAAAGVDRLFVERWSPRAYLPEDVSEADQAVIFDAARWSPSCFNEQPWRFVTCTKTSHADFLACLVEANQQWAASAPVLGFVLARLQFLRNGKANHHAVFDTGAAWLAVNLQAQRLGYQAHGMAGVDFDAAARLLQVDTRRERVICAFTLGVPDLAAKETITERKALTEAWQQT